MNFALDYATEFEVFIIFMILGRQREAIMLFLRSYNTHAHRPTRCILYCVNGPKFNHPKKD